MPCIIAIPATTQKLWQYHLSDPARIARLQQSLGATLMTDSAGHLSLVRYS